MMLVNQLHYNVYIYMTTSDSTRSSVCLAQHMLPPSCTLITTTQETPSNTWQVAMARNVEDPCHWIIITGNPCLCL